MGEKRIGKEERMSYFPEDIPFMSKEELKENGIRIPKMDNLISRQQTIDALNEYFARIGKLKRKGLTEGEKAISLDTVGIIKTLPPVQPKSGKWIPQRCGGLYCSECGGYALDISDGNFINIVVPSNYCPHCGASMKNRHSIIVKDLNQKEKKIND